MSLPRPCEQLRERASAYRDGLLIPRHRAVIEAHLARCVSCREFYDSLARIGSVCERWPDAPLPAGLGRKLREQARRRATLRRSTAIRRAAGILILLGVAAASFGLGFRSGKRSAPPTPALVRDEAAALASEDGLRGARSLLADLGIIDRLDPRLVRPLLRADLERLQLARWARSAAAKGNAETRRLARLVARVEDALEERDGKARLEILRREALAGIYSDPKAVTPPQTRAEAKAMAGAHAFARGRQSALPEDLQEQLDHLLRVKESLARGRHWEVVELAQKLESPPAELGPAFRLNLALGLSQAGLPTLARPFVEEIDENAGATLGKLCALAPTDGENPELRWEETRARLQSLFDTRRDQHPGDPLQGHFHGVLEGTVELERSGKTAGGRLRWSIRVIRSGSR